jgi:hypothetical protein
MLFHRCGHWIKQTCTQAIDTEDFFSLFYCEEELLFIGASYS